MGAKAEVEVEEILNAIIVVKLVICLMNVEKQRTKQRKPAGTSKKTEDADGEIVAVFPMIKTIVKVEMTEMIGVVEVIEVTDMIVMTVMINVKTVETN